MWMLFLLVAWAAAILSCARLCRAAVAAAELSEVPPGSGELGLYEMAFLSGGPRRVTELAMVTMGRERRLLLAHTGWATVVDPEGRDDLERSLIASIGPDGQARIPAIRTAHAAADAIRALGDRLSAAGLAVPAAARDGVSATIREVQAAIALTLLMLAGATAITTVPVLPWFVLPLLLASGCLVIARVEVYPYTRWASPAGQDLLREIATDGEDQLTALAVRGPATLTDPVLRAALG